MSWESFGSADGFGHDGMLARIRGIRFATTRLRPGYVMADVDAFLGRVEAGLTGAAPPLTPQEVREVRFGTTRLAQGYAEDEVDAFLDELEAYVGRAGSG